MNLAAEKFFIMYDHVVLPIRGDIMAFQMPHMDKPKYFVYCSATKDKDKQLRYHFVSLDTGDLCEVYGMNANWWKVIVQSAM